jgi:hypothetical protein
MYGMIKGHYYLKLSKRMDEFVNLINKLLVNINTELLVQSRRCMYRSLSISLKLNNND